MYHRTITERIVSRRGQGKIIIIYGARQVGKTTLCKYLVQDREDVLFVTGDDTDLLIFLQDAGLSKLTNWSKGYKTIIIDEAQKVRNIGTILKLLVDHFPEKQVIATGSSSFELANSINEPLTGRTATFFLHPFSLYEWGNNIPTHERQAQLEQRMILGMYPQSIITNDLQYLSELSQSYVYKDIFTHEYLKKPDLIVKLLQALALQIGSEISINELSQIVGADNKTVVRYLSLLEQAFIIFHLPAFSRNHRNEIKKSKKIYFWDLGVRNSLIRNVNLLHLRNDVGGIRENFVISERLKHNANSGTLFTPYFWRTIQQQEIDYIEEANERLTPYEIKRSSHKTASLPTAFQQTYNPAPLTIINPDTLRPFVGR